MNRSLVFLAVTICPVLAFGQADSKTSQDSTSAFRPAVPAPSSNASGWWPGYVGATSTVGSALNGLASVISAGGDYNLSSSAAAVNLTQAERNDIQNRLLAANAYFEARDAWHARMLARRGPLPTVEQIARLAHYGVPRPLTPNEFDSVSGRLNWPSALQQDMFAAERDEVNRFFEAWARYGELSYADQTKLRETINGLFDDLNSQMREMPPPVYVECRRFLRSLIFAATRADLQ
jgi:hypothetical protein